MPDPFPPPLSFIIYDLACNQQIICGYSAACCDGFGLRSGRVAGMARILGLISVGGVWQAGFPCFGAEQGIYQGLITGNFAIPMLAEGERHPKGFVSRGLRDPWALRVIPEQGINRDCLVRRARAAQPRRGAASGLPERSGRSCRGMSLPE